MRVVVVVSMVCLALLAIGVMLWSAHEALEVMAQWHVFGNFKDVQPVRATQWHEMPDVYEEDDNQHDTAAPPTIRDQSSSS